MVAQMTDESMRKVVRGPQYLSRGIVHCTLIETEKFDHARHDALKKKRDPDLPKLKVWDFLLQRDDGTCITFHPEYSKTKFKCLYSLPKVDHAITRKFREFKNKQKDDELRFDPAKAWDISTAVAGAASSSGATPPVQQPAVAEAAPAQHTAVTGAASSSGEIERDFSKAD